jgi:hypothetical protein
MTLALPSYPFNSSGELMSSVATDGIDSGTIVTIVFGIAAAIMTAVNIWQNRHYFRNARAALAEQGQSPISSILECHC